MTRALALTALLVPLAAAGCGGGGKQASSTATPPTLNHVTLQLPAGPRATFAGYYAAKAKGYYIRSGLDVAIRPASAQAPPVRTVGTGHAEFGLAPLAAVAAARAKGTDLVAIAQVSSALFARDAWLASKTNADIARRFLEASFRGWISCRDHPASCAGPAAALKKVNAAIWPAGGGIGVIRAGSAAAAAYRTDLAKAADKTLQGAGLDVNGKS